MFEFIQAQLENQFLSGGMVLMLLGATLAMSRRIPGHIYSYLHRKLVTTVDVSDQDQAFYWIQEWLSQHEYSKRSRLLTITTQRQGYEDLHRPKEIMMTGEAEEEEKQPEVFFTPAPGLHLLKFEGHWLLLWRTRQEVTSTSTSQYWRDMFTIRTFARDRDIFRRLVLEARSVAFPENEKRLSIFATNYSNWQVAATRMPRDASSVILKDGLMEDILQDVETFFNSADWYRDRGIPYQRGYLFHGSPGNGKTSLALALSSKFQRDIYLTKVTSIEDDPFRALMSSIPRHSIVLLEDVDCFFEGRENVSGGDLIRVLTFSGFLNAIDGIIGSEGRLLIMTTNCREKLDPALLRAGRVDRQVELCNATRDQAKRLFLRFFEDEDAAERFAAALTPGAHSMADLQGVLLNNRGAEAAVDELARQRIRAVKEAS